MCVCVLLTCVCVHRLHVRQVPRHHQRWHGHQGAKQVLASRAFQLRHVLEVFHGRQVFRERRTALLPGTRQSRCVCVECTHVWRWACCVGPLSRQARHDLWKVQQEHRRHVRECPREEVASGGWSLSLVVVVYRPVVKYFCCVILSSCLVMWAVWLVLRAVCGVVRLTGACVRSASCAPNARAC